VERVVRRSIVSVNAADGDDVDLELADAVEAAASAMGEGQRDGAPDQRLRDYLDRFSPPDDGCSLREINAAIRSLRDR
jgi:hypothetical protein